MTLIQATPPSHDEGDHRMTAPESAETPWLPPTFEHPTRVELGTGHHLRPIRATDVDLDMPAVMGSQQRLGARYRQARRRPPRGPRAPAHRRRPSRATGVDLDMPAVMGSQQRLRSIYGKAWAWPPPDMTHEQDREDLARHEAEIEAHESFNYALFDDQETALLGCVYIR